MKRREEKKAQQKERERKSKEKITVEWFYFLFFLNKNLSQLTETTNSHPSLGSSGGAEKRKKGGEGRKSRVRKRKD